MGENALQLGFGLKLYTFRVYKRRKCIISVQNTNILI